MPDKYQQLDTAEYGVVQQRLHSAQNKPLALELELKSNLHTRKISSTIIIILFLDSFSHQRRLMDFHWSLSDNKSLQFSRILLSISADLNSVEIWMVSTRPVISKSSSAFNNPSWYCNKNTNYNWYKRHFHIP